VTAKIDGHAVGVDRQAILAGDARQIAGQRDGRRRVYIFRKLADDQIELVAAGYQVVDDFMVLNGVSADRIAAPVNAPPPVCYSITGAGVSLDTVVTTRNPKIAHIEEANVVTSAAIR